MVGWALKINYLSILSLFFVVGVFENPLVFCHFCVIVVAEIPLVLCHFFVIVVAGFLHPLLQLKVKVTRAI